MKLFGVILKGFLILWVPLTLTIMAFLTLVLEVSTAITAGGIAGTLIAGFVTYLVVNARAKAIEQQQRQQRGGRPEVR